MKIYDLVNTNNLKQEKKKLAKRVYNFTVYFPLLNRNAKNIKIANEI